MKRIEEFITSVYAHVKDKEANELKTEMRTHLLEAVEELKAEGKSEE
ncbi:permease prefix domain 1-containing protein, partial [Paenibacillus artemisiicola]